MTRAQSNRPAPNPADLDEFDPIADNGLQQCPYCGTGHYPPVNPIITDDGEHFDDPLDTSPGTPWYCPDCWEDRNAEIVARQHMTLTEFADGHGTP